MSIPQRDSPGDISRKQGLQAVEKLTHHWTHAIKIAQKRHRRRMYPWTWMFCAHNVYEAKERAFAPEKRLMQDKSFLQAMQEVQERVSSHIEEAIGRMLLDRTTATYATRAIQDESMRAVVTNELITGQIIALLALLRDEGILDEAQYDEFAAYLRRSLVSHYRDVIARRASH